MDVGQLEVRLMNLVLSRAGEPYLGEALARDALDRAACQAQGLLRNIQV